MRNRTIGLEQRGRGRDDRRGRHSQSMDDNTMNSNDADGNEGERKRRRRRRERGEQDGPRSWQSGRRGGQGSRRHGRGGERRRGRAKRGEARYILLDVLRDGPKHGYEMIKTLDERSGGQYVPSPGTVYPTLQYLEDQGLVRAEEDAERRVYHLTEAGTTELEAQAALIDEFWAQFTPPPPTAAGQPELGFLEEEVDHLNRIVWNGVRNAITRDDQATIRQVREVIEACQTQVRTLIANAATGTDSSGNKTEQV